MLDRREFLTSTLMGAAAAVAGCSQKEPAGPKGGTSLTFTFKGQCAYLTPRTGSTAARIKVACLTSERVQHDGWLFLNKDSVDLPNSTVAPDDTSIDGWLGWNLKRKGDPKALRVHLPDGSVIVANLSQTTVDARSNGCPDPLDADASWYDPQWIPNASVVSPDSDELVDDWEDQCEWILELPLQGQFQGRKPCKVRDIQATWAWISKTGRLYAVRAATDLVVYNSIQLALPQLAIVGRGVIQFSGNVSTLGVILCAPPHQTGGPDHYEFGEKIEHFTRFYSILKNPSNAEMTFALRVPINVTPGACPTAAKMKDDDIFCPGMQIALL